MDKCFCKQNIHEITKIGGLFLCCPTPSHNLAARDRKWYLYNCLYIWQGKCWKNSHEYYQDTNKCLCQYCTNRSTTFACQFMRRPSIAHEICRGIKFYKMASTLQIDAYINAMYSQKYFRIFLLHYFITTMSDVTFDQLLKTRNYTQVDLVRQSMKKAACASLLKLNWCLYLSGGIFKCYDVMTKIQCNVVHSAGKWTNAFVNKASIYWHTLHVCICLNPIVTHTGSYSIT